IRARLAQNLVGLPKLPVLPLKSLHLRRHIRRQTGPLAGIDLGFLHPMPQRVRLTADLAGDRLTGSPAAGKIRSVLQHHPHGTLALLRGKLVRRFARHGSILFGSWSLRQTRGGSMGSSLMLAPPSRVISTHFQTAAAGASSLLPMAP